MGGFLTLLVWFQRLQPLFSEALAGDRGPGWWQWRRCGRTELGFGWGGTMVMELALVAELIPLGQSSQQQAGTALPLRFLLASSLGSTYGPTEDSRVMLTSLEVPAPWNRMKPVNISDPLVIPESPDPTGTPGSRTPSPTTTEGVMESSSSSPEEPFAPGTATGARSLPASLGGQSANQSGWEGGVCSGPCRAGEVVLSEDDLDYVEWVGGVERWLHF